MGSGTLSDLMGSDVCLGKEGCNKPDGKRPPLRLEGSTILQWSSFQDEPDGKRLPLLLAGLCFFVVVVSFEMNQMGSGPLYDLSGMTHMVLEAVS